MSNLFALVSVLKVSLTPESEAYFKDAMSNAYYSHVHDYEDITEYVDISEEVKAHHEKAEETLEKISENYDWVDINPEEINTFVPGTIFRAVNSISGTESTYVVIGKTTDGEVLYVPTGDDPRLLLLIYQFDTESDSFIPFFKSNMDDLTEMVESGCELFEPDKFYMITDIHQIPVDFADMISWSDDDDEEEEDVDTDRSRRIYWCRVADVHLLPDGTKLEHKELISLYTLNKFSNILCSGNFQDMVERLEKANIWEDEEE